MPERKPVIVTRAEPPDELAPAQLSKEEMRALIAVTAVTHRTPWGRVARRGALVAVPAAAASMVLDALLGWWSIPVIVVLAIVWTTRPLVRQNREGW